MEKQAPVECGVEQGCRVTGCLHHTEGEGDSRCVPGFGMTFTKNNLGASHMCLCEQVSETEKKTETKKETD